MTAVNILAINTIVFFKKTTHLEASIHRNKFIPIQESNILFNKIKTEYHKEVSINIWFRSCFKAAKHKQMRRIDSSAALVLINQN
jgi:hypothetical protein